MLAKIIEIWYYYKSQIREIIKDIKTYWIIIFAGSAFLIAIIYSIFYFLGGFMMVNLKLALSSIVGLLSSFILNLYFSTIPKLRDSDKKKKKNHRRIENYFKHRHNNDPTVAAQIEKEYMKVVFDPPIE